jgi:hypothetical protein
MHFYVSDGCTYSCTCDIPFLYESAEAAIVDFELICKPNTGEFTWATHPLHSDNFYYAGQYQEPEFYTLQEWWEKFSA